MNYIIVVKRRILFRIIIPKNTNIMNLLVHECGIEIIFIRVNLNTTWVIFDFFPISLLEYNSLTGDMPCLQFAPTFH